MRKMNRFFAGEGERMQHAASMNDADVFDVDDEWTQV